MAEMSPGDLLPLLSVVAEPFALRLHAKVQTNSHRHRIKFQYCHCTGQQIKNKTKQNLVPSEFTGF